MRIRHVRAGEGERWKAIRLGALRADPQGFSSTFEREAALPDEWWTSRAALSEAGDSQRTFVAVDDEDHWLGTALARAGGDVAILNAMWVAPEARGHGAGLSLCDACVAWSAAHGFGAVEVGVFPENVPARRLYERAGFVAERTDGRELILRRGTNHMQ